MADADKIVVAQRGTVYIGAVGTVVADDPDVAVPGSFTDLGYTTEDGCTFGASADVTDINAWQSATPVRRIVTGRGITANFSLEEWSDDNFALAFGGGTWTQNGDRAVYNPPADEDALAEYQMVIDFQDGSKKSRLQIFRGNVADSVETTLARNGAAVLPITFTGLTPDGATRSWKYASNDPTLIAALGS